MAWVSTMSRNSDLQRLGRLDRDHFHAVEQRQAGLDAAHDDVDRIRKRLREIRLRGASSETTAASAAGRRRRQSRATAATSRPVPDRKPRTNIAQPDDRRRSSRIAVSTRSGRPARCGPRAARLVALLVALLEFLERGFDDVAAGFLRSARYARQRFRSWRRSPCAARLCARRTGSGRRKPRPRRRWRPRPERRQR